MTINIEGNLRASAQSRAEEAALEVKLWTVRKRVTQKTLAEVLDLPQSSVSARLNGKKPFSLDELYAVAELMELSLGELLGSQLVNEKSPHPIGGGSLFVHPVVPPVGLEPTTKGL